ncbi:hypothetical protein [Devosia sp. MC521]|uniref:hypothetical protein n=1 Tax=Devosia sp. MC521 TaxID=2759954 RepID=UPI0015FBBB7A|nr:hypothetical protein [Devosia sp. MC521]MBJ6986065.1 hypothetical protein [Devosia sp. MC521]QMW61435.1 hypothetical protein H4N61_10615 [Devosia sp. MC521]
MLNDDELTHLRDAFFQTLVPLTYSRDEAQRLAWADLLLDPTPGTMRALMAAVPGRDMHMLLMSELIDIGVAHCSDVLNGVRLPLDDVRDRRWQLRRELARIVAGMDDERLQRLVYWARSIADV